jgi:predicted site-specific integrase-resolvase
MGAEVVITQGDDAADEASLVKDVLAIITVFSARLYGSRSHSRRKTAAGAIAA